MRAHELIFEARNPQNYRSQKKTWQDLEQALPRIQTAIEQFQKGVTLYRGLSYSNSSVLFKPQMPKGTRTSKKTDDMYTSTINNNIYTLFIDNNAKWKDYPPRSSSVISSTHENIANDFGKVYVVLPEGNPTIGIAPENDIWHSFPRLEEVKFAELLDLTYTISNVVCQLSHTNNYNPKSWSQLQKDLHKIDQINYLSFPDLPNHSTLILNLNTSRLLSFHPRTTMEQKLDYLLDPYANGFKVTTLRSLTPSEDEKEIWFSAPCWLIQYDLMQNYLSNSFNLEDWIKQKAAQEQR